MSIRIDGTNTTANPGITGGDADTGLQFGTDEIQLVTGGTNRATVESNGNFTIEDGNLVVAAGHGIDFSADANAAGMTSELLDDYEEGTWTPTAIAYSGTLSVNSAYYVKVGDLVHVQMYVEFTNTSDPSNVIIGGLPFVAGGGVGNEYSLLTAHTDSNLNDFAMRARGTTSSLDAVYNNGGSGDAKPNYTTLAAKFIIMGGTYYAA